MNQFVGLEPFSGYQLIETAEMVTRVEKVIKHTRRWKKHGYRRISLAYPMPDVLVDHASRRIYGHPQTLARLRSAIQQPRTYSFGAAW
jgi:hypothetical protein